MRDIELIFEYLEHLRERLEPEYLKQCIEKKLDPKDHKSAFAVKCVWADYLMAKNSYGAGPLSRICHYLIETEKNDFLENYPEAKEGFTGPREREFIASATHIFPVVIRYLDLSLFDFGINRLKVKEVDLDKIKKDLKESGVLEKTKPEDSLLTIDFNGDDDLFITVDWDLGPAGSKNCASFIVKRNGVCSISVGSGFKSGDMEEDAYVEKCIRRMFHRVNDAVKKVS